MTYYNVESLDFIQDIRKNFSTLKKEFLEMYHIERNFGKKLQSVTSENKDFYSGDIDTLTYKIDSNLLDSNERMFFNLLKRQKITAIENRKKNSPYHSKFIDKFDSVRAMYYNVMKPKSRINPHYGVNGIPRGMIPDHFRIHVTIESGSNAYFCIENLPPLKYEEELCFGFEDGLVKHWAENNGDDTRVVLLLDVDKKVIKEYTPLVK